MLGVHIEFLQGNWLEPVGGRHFDIIVANPPYVANDDLHLHQGDVRFEPQQALVSQEQGLADINVIVRKAKVHLKPGGIILLEHGYDQAKKVRTMLYEWGYARVRSWPDLGSIERVSGATLSE
jgi:release factor glutamine methyltransferase